jgi:hypothetical protein
MDRLVQDTQVVVQDMNRLVQDIFNASRIAERFVGQRGVAVLRRSAGETRCERSPERRAGRFSEAQPDYGDFDRASQERSVPRPFEGVLGMGLWGSEKGGVGAALLVAAARAGRHAEGSRASGFKARDGDGRGPDRARRQGSYG